MNAAIAMFLALYIGCAACVVIGAALMSGLPVALFAAAPFFLGLCAIVGIGIARNG